MYSHLEIDRAIKRLKNSLGRAESNASGKPEWESTTKRIEEIRKALATLPKAAP